MPIFEYLTFVCDQDELQDRLTKAGLESWRLHTCEPVVMVGDGGASGILQVLVVLDRVDYAGEEDATEEDQAPEGLAMRG